MTEADSVTPRLRFLQMDGYSVLAEFGWTGPWPPPERFRVHVGTQSGIVRVMPDDEPVAREEQDALEFDGIESFYFRMTSCSRFNDEEIRKINENGTLLMRGAQYEREGEIDGDSLVR